MKNKIYPVLLITGTINVSTRVPFVAVTNPDIRLKDYISTINWAIKSTNFDSIVFCENSGFNLNVETIDTFAKAKNKRFEYMTFIGNIETIQKKGKGYGEGEIIQYALNNSKLLQENSIFCKLTGRLMIKNINDLIKKPQNYFMHIKGEKKIDTRFYCIKKQDYVKIFYDSYKKVNDLNGYYLENVFYNDLILSNIKYRCFYGKPYFLGISGSTGVRYEEKKNRIKKIIDKLFCDLNIYNSYRLWLFIHKIYIIR